jgi:hypothetical protein
MNPILLFVLSPGLCSKTIPFSVPRSQIRTSVQNLATGSSLSINFESTHGIVSVGPKSGNYSNLKQIALIRNKPYKVKEPGFVAFGNNEGKFVITAIADETIWITAGYVGLSPDICREVRPSVGEITLTASNTTGMMCFFRTCPESHVWLSGIIPRTVQVELWRKDAHGLVVGFGSPGANKTNASNVDALIVQVSETEDSKNPFNLRLHWWDTNPEYQFRPVSGNDPFGSKLRIFSVGPVFDALEVPVPGPGSDTPAWKGWDVLFGFGLLLAGFFICVIWFRCDYASVPVPGMYLENNVGWHVGFTCCTWGYAIGILVASVSIIGLITLTDSAMKR